MDTKQKIDHIVLNVPNMAKFSYVQYFGTPKVDEASKPAVFTIEELEAHARQVMEAGVLDIDVLYDDVSGNGELVDALPA